MKRLRTIALALLLLLALTGCVGQRTANQAQELILESYYRGQEDRAFDMLQKQIFQSMLESWTAAQIGPLTNPTWHFDTFTQYHRLDAALAPLPDPDSLYACTFSADEGRFGYIVMSYNGEGLSNVRVVETPSLYDLRASLPDLTGQLNDTALDGTTAVASRVSILNPEETLAMEAILIEDGTGQQFLYDVEAASEDP